MSSTNDYRGLIDEAITSHPLAGMPGLVQLGSVQGVITESVRRALIRMVANRIDTPEERSALRDAAVAAFDAWDIPRISGLIESSVKAMARPLLVDLLDSLLQLSADALADV